MASIALRLYIPIHVFVGSMFFFHQCKALISHTGIILPVDLQVLCRFLLMPFLHREKTLPPDEDRQALQSCLHPAES